MKLNSMKKDFQMWHKLKTDIHENNSRVFFYEREIWFSYLGTNIGFEEDGKGVDFARPVIVFRKFNNEVLWALPLTTKNKIGKFYLTIDIGDNIYRMAILSQLRLIDAKRLYQKIGEVSESTHKLLEEMLIRLCQGK